MNSYQAEEVQPVVWLDIRGGPHRYAIVLHVHVYMCDLKLSINSQVAVTSGTRV